MGADMPAWRSSVSAHVPDHGHVVHGSWNRVVVASAARQSSRAWEPFGPFWPTCGLIAARPVATELVMAVQRELVERAIEGDFEAFSVLVIPSTSRQYAIATLILRDGTTHRSHRAAVLPRVDHHGSGGHPRYPAGTAKSRLHRGLQQMRSNMNAVAAAIRSRLERLDHIRRTRRHPQRPPGREPPGRDRQRCHPG